MKEAKRAAASDSDRQYGDSSADERAVLVLSSDLLTALRLAEAAQASGYRVRTVPDLASLGSAFDARSRYLALLDLTDPAFPFELVCAALAAAPRPVQVLAFYPHVRGDLAERARAAGFALSMPRSRLLLNPASAFAAGFAALPPA